MIERYFQGVVPSGTGLKFDARGRQIIEFSASDDFEAAVRKGIEEYNFSLALEKIWELIAMANKYVEEAKPWNLAKENRVEELKAFIAVMAGAIKKVRESLEPFMPETAASIKEQLGSERINKGKPLFPRIE
jgi:methionyl-tRNA synthetase